MRKLLLLAVAFLLLASPAWAVETTDITVTVDPILEFSVDFDDIDFVIDTYSDYDGWVDGDADVAWTLNSNAAWAVDASCPETDFEVRVNGVAIDSVGVEIDSDVAGAYDSTWEIEVWVDSPTAPGTYTDTVTYTAS